MAEIECRIKLLWKDKDEKVITYANLFDMLDV